MKRLFVVVLALTTCVATAQQGGHKREKHPKMEMIKDMSPEQQATLKTKQMALKLNLDDSQTQAIYDLNLIHAKERELKRAEMKERKAERDGEKPSKEEIFNMMNERLDRQIAHKQKMKQILSTDQFERWERMNKRQHQKKELKRQRFKRSR